MRGVIRSVVVALVLSVVFAASVAAGPFEDGYSAYQSGDYATALRLFRPLAEQGDTDAQFSLGKMYRKGEGAPQDTAEAAKWYRMAAEQGHASAQVVLGTMYNNGGTYDGGNGVPQDYVQAHKWVNLAASRESLMRADRVERRDAVAAKMTPEQIAEAQRLAREWKPKTWDELKE